MTALSTAIDKVAGEISAKVDAGSLSVEETALLGRTIEGMVLGGTVEQVTTEGDTQVTAVQTEAATQITAIQNAASAFALPAFTDNTDSPVTVVNAASYICDVSGGSIQFNLPASPVANARYRFAHSKGNVVANNIIINLNGGPAIDDVTGNLEVDVPNAVIELYYNGTTYEKITFSAVSA